MDEAPRSRTRAIRTLGRLSTPRVEDVLLAQWAGEAFDSHLLQDIAIASDWAMADLAGPWLDTQRGGLSSHHRAAVRAYEDHMVDVVERLLEAIDSDVADKGRIPLAYEAPPVTQETALASLAALVAAEDMTIETASQKRDQITELCEASARLWVLAGLYRSGHISLRDLASKRSEIASHLG